MTMDKKQMDLFKAETTWFHVFVSMIENGDVAKMGPYAVTVYLVVKAYTNWKTGKAFPSIETIAETNELLGKYAPDFDVIQATVGRGRKIGSYHIMDTNNPVMIFTAYI